MKMVLILRKKLFEAIVRHSEEVFPVEACGILLGKTFDDKRVVKEICATKNVLNSESRYQVDPAEQLRVFGEADRKGLEIVGFYHSHPRWAPLFSDADKAEAHYRGYSYLVYSVRDKDAKSFIPRLDGIGEEEIELAP